MAAMSATEWIAEHAPGFRDLCREEYDAITDFSLLWSFFEGRVLKTSGNAESIMRAARQWARQGLLAVEPFQPEVAYFREHYFAEGGFTYHISQLHFRRPDREEMVKRVLSGESNDSAEAAAAALIIVYRYRNNLFHGEKWSYNLQGQFDNFNHANSVLKKAIELHRKSRAQD